MFHFLRTDLENWDFLTFSVRFQFPVLETRLKKLLVCHGITKGQRKVSLYFWLRIENFLLKFSRKEPKKGLILVSRKKEIKQFDHLIFNILELSVASLNDLHYWESSFSFWRPCFLIGFFSKKSLKIERFWTFFFNLKFNKLETVQGWKNYLNGGNRWRWSTCGSLFCCVHRWKVFLTELSAGEI